MLTNCTEDSLTTPDLQGTAAEDLHPAIGPDALNISYHSVLRGIQGGPEFSKKQVVGSFSGPLFGLAVAPNNDLVVADAGAGVVTKDGILEISAPGASSVSPIGRGSMWVVAGAGEDPFADTGQALYRGTKGNVTLVANLFEFEAANDPDEGEAPESNPFDVVSLGGNAALVADAAGNDLLRIDNRGNVEILAVFPDELVSTANLKALAGCPDSGHPFCTFDDMMPAQPVPTSIAIGPDGSYYVGELKGFPAPTNESNIWRVSPGASLADCGNSPDCVKVFDGGFTSIIDLTFGADGMLYVAELDEASWFALEGAPAQSVGGTVNACDVATLQCTVIASGIPMLTSVVEDANGTLWVTRNALIPSDAEVVQIP